MHKSCALFIQFESLLSADRWRWPWTHSLRSKTQCIWLLMMMMGIRGAMVEGVKSAGRTKGAGHYRLSGAHSIFDL